MHRLATVLLRHDTPGGVHYDWLMGDPADPAGLLWTARVAWPSRAWRQRRVWNVETIGRHRRLYLSYQGPVSGGRGRVVRVDAGWVLPRLWAVDRAVVDLELRDCRGTVELRHLGGRRWRAGLIG